MSCPRLPPISHRRHTGTPAHCVRRRRCPIEAGAEQIRAEIGCASVTNCMCAEQAQGAQPGSGRNLGGREGVRAGKWGSSNDLTRGPFPLPRGPCLMVPSCRETGVTVTDLVYAGTAQGMQSRDEGNPSADPIRSWLREGCWFPSGLFAAWCPAPKAYFRALTRLPWQLTLLCSVTFAIERGKQYTEPRPDQLCLSSAACSRPCASSSDLCTL